MVYSPSMLHRSGTYHTCVLRNMTYVQSKAICHACVPCMSIHNRISTHHVVQQCRFYLNAPRVVLLLVRCRCPRAP